MHIVLSPYCPCARQDTFKEQMLHQVNEIEVLRHGLRVKLAEGNRQQDNSARCWANAQADIQELMFDS